MSRLTSLSVMAALLGSLLLSQQGIGQEAKSDAKAAQKATEKKAKAAGAAKSKGRLPNYYAQVGIDEAQKMQIYNVQAKYAPEIEKATQALNDLKAKELMEIEGVLTAEQKAKVAELQESAKQKRKPGAKPGNEAPAAEKKPAEAKPK